MSHPHIPPPDVIASLPPDGGPSFNRLIHSTSPYLLQHAANPVDWYPWGDEAFLKAKKEQKPVFLSVGYSSCHWCHVMAHESFEHPDVAEVLNRDFVPVKVDREERPDIDEIYMTATQLMTGRGGWPNSVWLLPDRRPWYAGTYFPREDRPGMAGFITLLNRLTSIWHERMEDVEQQATALSDAMTRNAQSSAGDGEATDRHELRAVTEQAVRSIGDQFDPRHGGFGSAPKFPPHAALRLHLHQWAQGRESQEVRIMVETTLNAMMHGGIHDHVGGGFHRYSVDETWLVPHFEKMLYDNAQLAWIYAEAARQFGHQAYAETARGICDWVLRDMTDKAGGFYSALDADSGGGEGLYYLWSYDEILTLLGPNKGRRFAQTYHILPEGNFHDEATGRKTGTNIPHRTDGSDDDIFDSQREWREILRKHRYQRASPERDDKILTAWNGLMIGGLAHTGKVLGEPSYIDAAVQAADMIRRTMLKDHVLYRVRRNGVTGPVPGYLEDYAAYAWGLVQIWKSTGVRSWLETARDMTDRLHDNFHDVVHGGYFQSSAMHESMLYRTREGFDQAMPSGNGLAAHLLLDLYEADVGDAHLGRAGSAVAAFAPIMRRVPGGSATLVHAAMRLPMVHGAQDPATPVSASARGPIAAELFVETETVRPGEQLPFRILASLDPGWRLRTEIDDAHRQGPDPQVTIKAPDVFRLSDLNLQAGSSGNTHTVEIRGAIHAAHHAPEEDHTVTLVVSLEACNTDQYCAPASSIPLALRIQVRTGGDGRQGY